MVYGNMALTRRNWGALKVRLCLLHRDTEAILFRLESLKMRH